MPAASGTNAATTAVANCSIPTRAGERLRQQLVGVAVDHAVEEHRVQESDDGGLDEEGEASRERRRALRTVEVHRFSLRIDATRPRPPGPVRGGARGRPRRDRSASGVPTARCGGWDARESRAAARGSPHHWWRRSARSRREASPSPSRRSPMRRGRRMRRGPPSRRTWVGPTPWTERNARPNASLEP